MDHSLANSIHLVYFEIMQALMNLACTVSWQKNIEFGMEFYFFFCVSVFFFFFLFGDPQSHGFLGVFFSSQSRPRPFNGFEISK